MHLMYFTEQPMAAYDAKEGLDYGATALTFSNNHYDPVEGSRLYNEYLEEYILAEECGADGIMLNEHHNAPFCMQARTNMFGAILAAVTKRVKIVFLGNPLPLSENPVQLAEELAMIDMVSKGRLVSGFVRGGGQEQLANGVNPAYNRERFIEAHDLITKIWTQPGPFRWEGTHYQQRVVNPWALPMQKPYPRVWIPGVLSKETVIWTAQQRYPYIALNTSIEATKTIWDTYSQGGRRSRLYRRAGEFRLPDPRARAGHRRKGAAERSAVHVDAGRVHRPGTSGVGQSVGLFLAVRSPRVCRIRGRAGEEPARAADLRGAGRRHDDHRRHAGPGDRAAEVPDRADPAGHHGHLGQRRHGAAGTTAAGASNCW